MDVRGTGYAGGITQKMSTVIIIGAGIAGLSAAYRLIENGCRDIVVLEKYRNAGVGRRLMEGIQQAAASLGCSKITLEVREDNHNAQYLYQSLGYRECTPKMHFWEKRLADN